MKTCKATHCKRTDIKGHGYCAMHWQRIRAHGTTEPTQTPKGFALKHPVEYRCYSSMKTRCYNKNCIPYKNYGGRGITMCDRWLGPFGFVNFMADMGERPSDEYSLDRIDNDKEYSPKNCRWASAREQGNNRRTNRLLSYNGETHTEAEWARKIGVRRGTLHERLRRGVPLERALTMKKQTKYKKR